MSCKIAHRKIRNPQRTIANMKILLTFSLWNEQSQVYQLDFGGRVTLESAKNFQIEFKGKQVDDLRCATFEIKTGLLLFRLFNSVELKIIVIH